MKHIMKPIAILLTVLMTFSTLFATGPTAFAFKADEPIFAFEETVGPIVPDGFHLTGGTEVNESGETIWEAESEASEYGLVNVIWIDISGNKVQNPEVPLAYPVNEEGEPVVKGDTLPSEYDARNDGLITPVEYQVGGTCWAHAATACVETAYLKNFGTAYDLSEYHAAWFAKNSYYEGITDSANDGISKTDIVSGVLDAGGNMYEYFRAVGNFSGAVLESRYPLNTEDNSSRVGTAQLAEDMKNTFTYETRYHQDAIVEGIKAIPYSISALKQAVLDYGAAMVLYYSDDAYYTGGWYVGDDYPVAFYHPSATDTNHAVTLVGWDDNFSRENFGTYKPQSDGAWLIKNSWSSHWGNNGYFWISYEDSSIKLYDSYVVTVSDPSDYEDIYLHNGFSNVLSSNKYTDSANVFTARNDVYLSKISYGGSAANIDYTLKIYNGLDENCTDPTAGTLVYTQRGKTYGDEYIAVNGDVKISKGDRFSVVLELDRIYYETDHYTTCHEGDSFYYDSAAGEWVDTAGSSYGNVCIRAIAKYQKESDTYKVTFKDGNKHSETAVASDGTVALPQKAGHTYVLTYNNAEFTGTGISQDCTVNMHCYPTNGETSEDNECTTVYECIYCGEKMKEDVVIHSFSSEVVPATVRNIGYTVNTCNVCEEYIYSDINILSGAEGGQSEGFWWQYTDGNLCIFAAEEYKMPDFTAASETPWSAYLNDITTLTVGDRITYLGDYLFSGLPALSELNLPDSITEIGDYCFSGAKAIEVFDCPEGLTKIGTYAFNGAVSLEEINYNDIIRTIGSYAYKGCSSLTEVIIPGTLTSVGKYLFYNCPNVTKITVEEGVTSFSYQVWCEYGNSKLEELVIPSTATSVTFMNYAHLDKYTVSPDNKVYCSVDGVVFSKDMTTLYAYPATKPDRYYKVPSTVDEMDYYVFSYINGLEYLDMSDCSIKIIKDKAFNQTKTLSNVNLPKTTTNIWYQAFYRTKIASIYVPSTVTSYQDPPFTTGGSSSYNIPDFYTDSETAKIKEFADKNSYNCTVVHTAHNFSTTVSEMSKDPTCNNEGKSFKICECGNFEYKTVPATGEHSLVKGATTEPTCTEAGYTVYTCSVCGTEEKKDEVAALGHSFGWIIDREATCGAEGKKHEKCSICDAVRSSDTVISATGKHTYTSEITTPATHLKEGIEVFTCSVCGDSYTETVAKLEKHDYIKTVTVPTCEDKGYTTYTCACGDTYRADEVDALGHSYSSEVTVAPTCTEDGVKTYTCVNCGDTYTQTVSATGHSYEKKTTAPTCEDKGYTTYICACGDTYRADEVDALGHSYSSEVTAAPTCTEGGTKTYTCGKCGDSYTENVAATGHSVRNVAAKAPTCTEKGNEEYEYCVNCNYTTYKEIAAAGHSYNKKITAPTCTAKGYTTYTCSVCSDNYVADEVAASGHSYGQWSQIKAPDCTEKGKAERSCSICGGKDYKEIAKTGHSLRTAAIAPTCTERGYTLYECNNCAYSYRDNYIAAKGHSDNNADHTCDECGTAMSPSGNCSCNCHKNGFMAFIWRIINFFYKLFKTNKICACGAAHY